MMLSKCNFILWFSLASLSVSVAASPNTPSNTVINTVTNNIKPIVRPSVTPDINHIPLNTISPDTLKLFVKTLGLIRTDYISPVNDDTLLINAIQGMLKNLDPHAEFLDVNSYEHLQGFTQGDLAEIGLTVQYSHDRELWQVQDIHPESTAIGKLDKGDVIHSINDVNLLSSMTQKDIEQKMDGLAGSVVELIVSHENQTEYSVRLQRVILKNSLVTTRIEQSVAIITIPVFQDNTKQQIIEALVNLNEPMIGLVIDVRNNPGGILSSAIDVAGLFASDIAMVNIESRVNEEKTLKTAGPGYLKNIPTIILQNHNSASAAEVLASGLQFNGLATIAGERSYGKGTIQAVIPIDNDGAVKLTVAKYSQPDGQAIHGIGVIPDLIFPIIDIDNTLENTASLQDFWLSLAVAQLSGKPLNHIQEDLIPIKSSDELNAQEDIKLVTISPQDNDELLNNSLIPTKGWLFAYPK